MKKLLTKRILAVVAMVSLVTMTVFGQNNQTLMTLNDLLTRTFATFTATAGTITTLTSTSATITTATATTANTGTLTASTSIAVGGGTAITKILTATQTIDFANILTTAKEDVTVAVTGAAVGNVVTLGLPAAPAAGLGFMAYVSAADTVTIRAFNYTGVAVDAASASYRVTVLKY